MSAIELTDGYKLDHRRQYPEGTEDVYSTWIPRSNRYFPEAKDGVVVFGIQYLTTELENKFLQFFKTPLDKVLENWTSRINGFLGPDNKVGQEHIKELHDLGYLPIEIKALKEGTICPIGVPALTIHATDKRFFWLTNYLETYISMILWLPMTSATTARLYKKELVRHANHTGWSKEEMDNIPFLCHDFSMRGMAGLDAAITSGMGHLTSFIGSETIPAISASEYYYNAKGLVAATIPATEHSVMCAGGMQDEFGTFKRLITEVYPKGFVSIVSDTWDYWKVITEYLPALKDTILNREGRVVIRPDSGDPVDIICGTKPSKNLYKSASGNIINIPEENEGTPEELGTYEMLWKIFGGTINKQGYKVLHPNIGIIYGDSITLERQTEIYKRLEAKGFAATNLVLGIGSFTYQYRTRDSLGFAMKATSCVINGERREIFKDPKTDDGVKKSLKGLCMVYENPEGKVVVRDQVSEKDESSGLLERVFFNGIRTTSLTLEDIRNNLNNTI